MGNEIDEKKQLNGENDLPDEEETDEYEDEVIVLLDEEGNELECEVLHTFEFEGNGYVVLLPSDEDDPFILKIEKDENGNDIYAVIEDDEEFEKVSEAYDELLGEEEN
jgi:uncharacterized protein YrzB (UPF0473 family)